MYSKLCLCFLTLIVFSVSKAHDKSEVHEMDPIEVCRGAGNFWTGNAMFANECSVIIADGQFDRKAVSVCYHITTSVGSSSNVMLGIQCLREIKNKTIAHQSLDICFEQADGWKISQSLALQCLRNAIVQEKIINY